MPTLEAVREFVQHGRDAAACRVAQAVDRWARGKHRRHQSIQRLTVAGHVSLQRQLVARNQDSGAVVAQHPVDDNHIARPRLARRDRHAVRHHTDTGGVDEQLVGGTALDDLGVSGHDGDADRIGDALHAGYHAAQQVDLEAFLQHHAARQEQWPRAAHRQVVDGARHGESADVAAGEEQRVDHVGVRGEREPVAEPGQFGHRDLRLVLQCAKQRVVERRDEHVLDQRAHRPAAAAVRHVDARIAQRAAASCAGRCQDVHAGAPAATAGSGLSSRP